MRLTRHAMQRLREYVPVVGKDVIVAMDHKLRRALNDGGDVAVAVTLATPVGDPTDRNWRLCDRLVAVVRNGQIVTICLSRSSQMSASHFRVDRVLQ